MADCAVPGALAVVRDKPSWCAKCPDGETARGQRARTTVLTVTTPWASQLMPAQRSPCLNPLGSLLSCLMPLLDDLCAVVMMDA